MKNGNYEYKLLYSGQLSPIARLNDEDRVVENMSMDQSQCP